MMLGPTTIAQFRQIALFSDLSDADLGRICAEAWDFRLVPGDILFHEGDPGDRAFVVTEGQLEIRKMTDRNEMLIAVRGEGEVIGEMALLQSEPRSATVIARTHRRT
jgi:CRP/FNR family transcriptional regulator, cyclic AMP receptor protein